MHFIHFSHTFPLHERDFAQNKKRCNVVNHCAFFDILCNYTCIFILYSVLCVFFIRYLLIILSTTVNTFTNVFAMLYFNFSIMVSNSAASNSVASIICSNEYPFLCIFKITFSISLCLPSAIPASRPSAIPASLMP